MCIVLGYQEDPTPREISIHEEGKLVSTFRQCSNDNHFRTAKFFILMRGCSWTFPNTVNNFSSLETYLFLFFFFNLICVF